MQVEASIYDYPLYYDLVFATDWAAEFHFLEGIFERYASGQVESLFEPACGTGRLIYRFAKAGYEIGGLDLNAAAVEYCNQRLRKHQLPESAVVGDMTDFAWPQRCDAAFNTINSFRHLTSHQAASDHLRCMANVIRPGGLYVLGLHLTPSSGQPDDEEAWTARRGHLQVNTRMWLKERAPEKRLEEFHIRFEVYRPTGRLVIEDVLRLRSYTQPQFAELLSDLPEWEVAGNYDFRYRLNAPIEVDGRTQDVIYVLRRR